MLSISQENMRLFGKQVEDHIEKLNMLIGVKAGNTLGGEVVQKTVLATKLMEGSARMIGMTEWGAVLSLFRELMENCVKSERIWDDQLSQVVLDMLESEERVVANLYQGDSSQITAGCNFSSLGKEIEFILNEGERLTQGGDNNKEESEQNEEVFINENNQKPGPPVNDRTYSIMDGLTKSVNSIQDHLSDYLVKSTMREEIVKRLEADFGECEFFVSLISNIVTELGEDGKQFCSRVSSKVVSDGLNDFFAFYQQAEGWKAELKVSSDDFYMDRKLASHLVFILGKCVYGICSRYKNDSELKLSVEVETESKDYYLVVNVKDNAPDFLSDSELDREDAVAFYKGLLEVKNLLEKIGGLLWVEPDGGERARFRFTHLMTRREGEYCIINASGKEVAILSCNVADILDIDQNQIGGDQAEKYVVVNGTKLPFYSLEELASEKFGSGSTCDKLVVTGLAERRIGILCGGEIKRDICLEEQLIMEDWCDIADQILHVGEREIPVLDAGKILTRADGLRSLGDELKEVGVCSGEMEG